MYINQKDLLNQLEKKGFINKNQSREIEVASLQKNISVLQYLLEYTNLNRNDIFQTVAEVAGVKYVDLNTTPIDPQAVSFVSEVIARNFNVIPYNYNPQENTLYLATDNPLNLSIIDFLEKKTKKKIVLVLADPNLIKKFIDLSYSQGLSPQVKEALEEIQKEVPLVKQTNEIAVYEAPIAKIVTTILEYGVKSNASDIHIEPQEQNIRVRYRIDGILHEKLILPRAIHDALISRIKILSQMKIDEKRIPQDGRFNFKLGNDEVDLRVSTLPTVHGEKVVMRLLRKTGGIPSLPDLGLRGPQLKDLQEAISKPYGVILVTGPTGSGKTTTLYSLLSKLNQPGVNIVTLEDPVEYQIPGINQVQINPAAGLTFANGLRAFLRQDPNIILVGEIRDKETTQLAIQAALTGHLVFSTLHTNDSATAIPRLIDLGAEPFLIASVLNAVIAQRICRRVCPHCAITYEPDELVKKNIEEVLGEYFPQIYKKDKKIILVKGEGCSECNNTGYLGRIAIFEVLKVTPAITKMILQQASAKEIENQAKKEGLITMKQDGYLKALDKITTIEEVIRVAEIS